MSRTGCPWHMSAHNDGSDPSQAYGRRLCRGKAPKMGLNPLFSHGCGLMYFTVSSRMLCLFKMEFRELIFHVTMYEMNSLK